MRPLPEYAVINQRQSDSLISKNMLSPTFFPLSCYLHAPTINQEGNFFLFVRQHIIPSSRPETLKLFKLKIGKTF
jgi:hypothetical protein